jgi:hypothetical protein
VIEEAHAKASTPGYLLKKQTTDISLKPVPHVASSESGSACGVFVKGYSHMVSHTVLYAGSSECNRK